VFCSLVMLRLDMRTAEIVWPSASLVSVSVSEI